MLVDDCNIDDDFNSSTSDLMEESDISYGDYNFEDEDDAHSNNSNSQI